MENRGPSTEPWGAPQVPQCYLKSCISAETHTHTGSVVCSWALTGSETHWIWVWAPLVPVRPCCPGWCIWSCSSLWFVCPWTHTHTHTERQRHLVVLSLGSVCHLVLTSCSSRWRSSWLTEWRRRPWSWSGWRTGASTLTDDMTNKHVNPVRYQDATTSLSRLQNIRMYLNTVTWQIPRIRAKHVKYFNWKFSCLEDN